MKNTEHDELRRQLFEINVTIALLKKGENYSNNPEYIKLKELKAKIIDIMKKDALKRADKSQINQEIEEGRMKL